MAWHTETSENQAGISPYQRTKPDRMAGKPLVAHTAAKDLSSPIGQSHIELWCVDDESVVDEALKLAYLKLLSVNERDQMARFYFPKDRHQYLVTRALVRVVLSKYHPEVRPQDWQFSTNAYGKPYIVNQTKDATVHFNISHAKNMVMLAISSHEFTGVDVEHLKREGDLYEIADAFFSPDEVAQLLTLQDERLKKQRYFDLWTLKEAYVKACGMGLSLPLTDFSFIFDAHDRVGIQFNAGRTDSAEHWRFWRIGLSAQHAIALAIRHEEHLDFTIQIRKLMPLQCETMAEFSLRGAERS